MDGSTSADITRLVAEHHAAVYRAAFRLSGSTADAEDLTQQTFLTAHRSLGQLRDQRAALGWLMAILRSCFLKAYRKRRPLSADHCDLDLELCAASIPPESEIDAEQLQNALNELSADARLMLTMFYFEDLSYREIAAATDTPIGTVMSRLSRAKEQLRRKLSEKETTERSNLKASEPRLPDRFVEDELTTRR
ncbi:MAG: sigma-70 family RNA polymerase sigma factor [Planctomycetia bacterium]|nr:sigma-70 family RNA polymerase sigma factor [Planctomycetia bacterium]